MVWWGVVGGGGGDGGRQSCSSRARARLKAKMEADGDGREEGRLETADGLKRLGRMWATVRSTAV